jgi:hypothetical protein
MYIFEPLFSAQKALKKACKIARWSDKKKSPKNVPEPMDVVKNRGRCYGHNFLRFSPIFGEKIGVFSQKPMFQNFAQFTFVSSKKRQVFRRIFQRKYLNIIT